jgi:glutaredoxin
VQALPCLPALAAALLLLAGCLGAAPPGQVSQQTVTPPPAVPSYMVHVAGNNHGVVLLVGRSTCPWCMKTKALLANLSVDYYWIDLATLDQAETAQVMDALRVCGQVSSVPILVINGEGCIIGYNETQIREAIG